MISNDDIDTLARATAYGPDGDKLGRVGEVYLDNDTGRPAWITVVTGLFGTRRHFAPIDEAVLDRTGLRLPFDKDTITGAPNIDENGELTPLEEDELYRYYRRSGERSVGDSGFAEGRDDSGERSAAGGGLGSGTPGGGITGSGTPGAGVTGSDTPAAGVTGSGTPGSGTGTPHTGETYGTPTPPATGHPHAPSPDFAREEIAGNYRQSEGQRDEPLEHSRPGHTGSAPSAPSGTVRPDTDTARHATGGAGAEPEIVGPGPTGPAHFTPPSRDDSETKGTTSGEGSPDADRPRKPRLVRRVVTTEYYEETPDDDAGDTDRS